MENWEQAWYSRVDVTRWSGSGCKEAFKAGWDAASTNPGVETGPIFAGTMQGVERYLEAQDRYAFTEMRNAMAEKWINPKAGEMVIQHRQMLWAAVGDAWRIAQKLVD